MLKVKCTLKIILVSLDSQIKKIKEIDAPGLFDVETEKLLVMELKLKPL
jgi:hypothetical protein